MYDGMINVRKERGYTSHDVVARLRGILHQKKIGHTGTLDPDATGVLPVCLGKGTKLCDMITDREKTYRSIMLLGRTTDTQDVSGQILTETEICITEADIRRAAESFVGDYMQIPPMYSAIKIDGKKLYELARAGREVERKPRHVVIHSLEIKSVQLPYVTMEICCSKGTYIRTLCHDIGERLGCGACMAELTRTKVGRFDIGDAWTLDEIEAMAAMGENNVLQHMLSVEDMLADYVAVRTIDAVADKMLQNGNRLFADQLEIMKTEKHAKLMDGQKVRVYDSRNLFIAVYQYDEKAGSFKNIKMFV